MNKNYTRDDMIRALSKKLDMYIIDLQVIFDGFEEFLAEAIKERNTVELNGLFSIKYSKMKSRKQKNPRTKEEVVNPECERLIFTPSVNFRDILRSEDRKHIKKKTNEDTTE